MSTLKARFDPDQARNLLRSSFPDARDLTPLKGGEASQSTVEGFTELYRSQIAHWKDVVVRAKVKVE